MVTDEFTDKVNTTRVLVVLDESVTKHKRSKRGH